MQTHIAYFFFIRLLCDIHQWKSVLLILILLHRRSFSSLPFALHLVGVATQRELRSFLIFLKCDTQKN